MIRHGLPQVIMALVLAAAPARAQDAARAPDNVPAARVLRFSEQLELSDKQLLKLQALEKAQATAMGKATSAYLRAEADFLDASRGEDLVIRRAALEKRAKAAIDGEMTRLKAEKETRAVLNVKQLEFYATVAEQPGAKLWDGIVAPARIAFAVDAPADSGEVRISVSPVYADIYIDGVRTGSGRRIARLAAGPHVIKLFAADCTSAEFRIVVEKGTPTILTQTLTCGK